MGTGDNALDGKEEHIGFHRFRDVSGKTIWFRGQTLLIIHKNAASGALPEVKLKDVVENTSYDIPDGYDCIVIYAVVRFE
jgi:hypothetical protein